MSSVMSLAVMSYASSSHLQPAHSMAPGVGTEVELIAQIVLVTIRYWIGTCFGRRLRGGWKCI